MYFASIFSKIVLLNNKIVVGSCWGGWDDVGWRDEWKTGVYAVQYERQTALLGDGRRRRLGSRVGESCGEEFLWDRHKVMQYRV